MAREDCDQQHQPTTTTNNNNNNTAKCVQWARPPSGRLGSSPGFASNMSGVEFKSLKSRSVLSAPAAWFVAAESEVTRHGLAVADASGGSASRLCHPSRRIVRSGGTALRSSPHVFVPSRRALAHLSDQQGSGDCLHVRITHLHVPVRCCGACKRRCVRSSLHVHHDCRRVQVRDIGIVSGRCTGNLIHMSVASWFWPHRLGFRACLDARTHVF